MTVLGRWSKEEAGLNVENRESAASLLGLPLWLHYSLAGGLRKVVLPPVASVS